MPNNQPAKGPELFPRGTELPTQSPLFWVHQKDRYLRQLLIKDIEAETDRDLIVYFSDCTSPYAQIDASDDSYFAELLGAVKRPRVDLLLETNGGQTDAAEKLAGLLLGMNKDLRVIVPRRAKSNGTVLAIAGKEIVMGFQSELGPIDPNLVLAPNNVVPAELILKTHAAHNPIIVQIAQLAVKQTTKLAVQLLSKGMLAGVDPAIIDDLVKKIATREQYHSHGSVIDHSEAAALGLKVNYLPPENPLWQRIWLLRTIYEYDCRVKGLMKLFESNSISSGIAPPPTLPAKP